MNRSTVKFVVPGRPTRWQRPGQNLLPNGTVVRFTDPNAVAGKKVIAHYARKAMGLRRPFTGPVVLRVNAIFAIPVSWPPRLIEAARQARVWHVADPDYDQIVKQVMDAVVGICWIDDNQVCGFPNGGKRYGHPERTEVMLEALPQAEWEKTPGQRRLEERVAQEGWDLILNPPERRKGRT